MSKKRGPKDLRRYVLRTLSKGLVNDQYQVQKLKKKYIDIYEKYQDRLVQLIQERLAMITRYELDLEGKFLKQNDELDRFDIFTEERGNLFEMIGDEVVSRKCN